MYKRQFELFLSADEAFIDTLATAGLTRDRGALYAVGRIAVSYTHLTLPTSDLV